MPGTLHLCVSVQDGHISKALAILLTTLSVIASAASYFSRVIQSDPERSRENQAFNKLSGYQGGRSFGAFHANEVLCAEIFSALLIK